MKLNHIVIYYFDPYDRLSLLIRILVCTQETKFIIFLLDFFLLNKVPVLLTKWLQQISVANFLPATTAWCGKSGFAWQLKAAEWSVARWWFEAVLAEIVNR